MRYPPMFPAWQASALCFAGVNGTYRVKRGFNVPGIAEFYATKLEAPDRDVPGQLDHRPYSIKEQIIE